MFSRYLAFLYGVCLLLLTPLDATFATTYTVDIYARVAGCGDSIIDTSEQCDAAELGGATCESVGFDEGVLSCSTACTFITSSCTFKSSSSGGTRITQKSTDFIVPKTNVIVAGYASPGMTISLVKDGQRVATVPTQEDGSFQVTVTGFSSGVYRLQVIGTLATGEVVFGETFDARVLKDSTTKISGVILPPVIQFNLSADTLEVSGSTVPGAEVSLSSDSTQIATTIANQFGEYVFFVPQNQVWGKPLQVIVNRSDATVSSREFYSPSNETTEQSVNSCALLADPNQDCRVDVVDFFIMRWRYLTSFLSEKFDFNQDGTISIVDFSILAYHWTG